MTTEQMIQAIIDAAYPMYKRNSKGCVEAYKLDCKQPVDIDGITFTCWREYVCFKVAEYIKDKVPDCNLELQLDGNDTVIQVELDDDQQKKLNVAMNKFLKDRNLLSAL